MRHSRYSIHNPLHGFGIVGAVKPVGQVDVERLLQALTTVELVALHNRLSGGAWLALVRRVLNLRTSFLPLPDRDYVRSHVGAFSWSVISGDVR